MRTRRWDLLLIAFAAVSPSSALLQHEATPFWRRRYVCWDCAVGFDKLKNFEAHVAGKKHAFARERGAAAVAALEASAWEGCAESARRAFDLGSFLAELPTRSSEASMLSPHVFLRDMTPAQRGRLFRYFYDQALPERAIAAFSRVDARYGRLKEILESLEAAKVVERRLDRRRCERVLDVAAGHGLVGQLLRARGLAVVSSDAEQRDAVRAWSDAFDDASSFEVCDVRDLAVRASDALVVVHGCDDVNRIALDKAVASAARWHVAPCCLRAQNYLPHLHRGGAKGKRSAWTPLPDDTRFAFLCGALASRFHARHVDMIDPRITQRPIVLTGGGSSGDDIGSDYTLNN